MQSKKRSKEEEILKRLDRIEKNQKKLLKIQESILKEEELIEKEEKKNLDLAKEELIEEKKIEEVEQEELNELKKLEELEKQIEKELKVSPLKKVTQRDVIKGMLGALFGVVGHFAFAKGVELAEHYSFTRSTFLYLTSFAIIVLFLYFAGFRKVDDIFIFKVLPIRAIVIYISAIITVILVLFLYGKISFQTDFQVVYNTVAAISVLAVLGAGTADLLGKEE